MKQVYIIHHGEYDDDYTVDLIVENKEEALKIVYKLNTESTVREKYEISKRFMTNTVDDIIKVDMFRTYVNIHDQRIKIPSLHLSNTPIHEVAWSFDVPGYPLPIYWRWDRFAFNTAGELMVCGVDREQVSATLKAVATKLLSDPTMRMSKHLTSEGDIDV